MKVITEERLIAKQELLEDKNNRPCEYLDGKQYMIDELIESCEEIDTLTVSKLRPMGEVIGYTGGDILVYTAYQDNPGFESYIFDVLVCEYIGYDGNELMTDGQQYLGWIPMPTYKPE